MKPKAEIEQDILNITMKIATQYPEISKYIEEMPMNISSKDIEVVSTQNLLEYHNSLVHMLEGYSNTHKKDPPKNALSYYPFYPPADDIYNQAIQKMDIAPNDLTKNKEPNEEAGSMNEKSFSKDRSGDDLDVPGSELDDQQERNGNEDEENNYYSLGGDNHNDLEENSE